jgi:hypothetical protein
MHCKHPNRVFFVTEAGTIVWHCRVKACDTWAYAVDWAQFDAQAGSSEERAEAPRRAPPPRLPARRSSA